MAHGLECLAACGSVCRAIQLICRAVVSNYSSYEWTANPRIDILFNGVYVSSGAYVAPTFSFSGSAPYPATTGDVVVTALAVGPWANGKAPGQSNAATVSYPTEPCVQPAFGRFTGGGSQVRVGDVRVTRGLTIHCDLLLSNSLEVNWGGNKFHMTEHLTTVACTDDELISQFPPEAPL